MNGYIYEYDILIKYSISVGFYRYDVWVKSRLTITFCEGAVDTEMISGSRIIFLGVARICKMISGSTFHFLMVAVDMMSG